MKATISTISSKGQITIPAEVRRHLGVGASDKISVVITDEGRVELQPVRYTLEDVIASISPLPNESLDLEREIAEAMEDEAIRRARRMNIP